jgi:hypothetical protein
LQLGRTFRHAVGSIASWAALVVGALAGQSCGSDNTGIPQPQQVGSITTDPTSAVLERGTRRQFTAVVNDIFGKAINVPVVWSSSIPSVASFDANGVLTANDTGTTVVNASSLGGKSANIPVTVVWVGAATIAMVGWTQPNAATPGAIVSDSIRVLVTNLAGSPVAGVRVAFANGGGGSSVSPSVATTSANGLAATQWTLGPNPVLNTLTATVVDTANQPIAFVSHSPLAWHVTAYAALSVVSGNSQTAQILSDLPVAPSVKLVDSLGKPRPGVPITFSPTNGGRVPFPTVPTGADGVASPGTWTLGDIPGVQTLIARVESGTIKLQATGTGTPIHYTPLHAALGGFATCGLDNGGAATCMGQEPLIGGGDTINKSTPTAVAATVAFQSISGGSTHFCGVASADNSIYCWGVNALVDITGKNAGLAKVPTQLPSALAFSQVVVGASHTCALTPTQDAYCWGSNQVGQLGTRGDTTTQFVPTAVSGGFKFSTITSGVNHVCALTLSHDALCWGLNQFGQLGDGTTTNRVAPTLVGGGLSFQAIGGGDPWTCALTTGGTAYCWGVVQGSVTSTPHQYVGAPVFVSLAVGSAHACALTGDGSAYCWGNNQFGQLGDSTNVNRDNPTPVSGGLKFKSIFAGVAHTCGLSTDGSLLCWGSNVDGELGDKTSASRNVPRFVILGVTP